ncbi:hypothetical protein [Arthrobacter sp. R-11]|uniref:hypothetical protein n=1 Tax=Arthrobacter sp. R-11 TaxID=3404053 RepID=UPI003CF674FB
MHSPQFFHADHDCRSQPGRWYEEAHDVDVHYLPGTGPADCGRPQKHDPNTDPEWRERLDHKEG